MLTYQRMQIDLYLSCCTKLKSKVIKDLNLNPDTLNPTEEKVGNNLECTVTGDDLLNRTLIAQALRSRATFIKWAFMKLKSFCKAKDTVNRTKQQPKE